MAQDWVTEQLRKAFVRINKAAEAEEKRAAKEQRKKDRKSSSKARAAAIARAQKQAEELEQSRTVRPCSECGKPAKADPEFFLNPVQCDHCRERSKSIDLGIHPRGSVEFSAVSILKGGAPGLGKRK